MAIIDILLPKMGESVAEATITKLVVDAGANVEADEPIVEIATDKVDSEVPAPEDGTLVEWCVAEGDVVQVGAVIARYDVGGEGEKAVPAAAPAALATEPAASSPSEADPAPEVVAAALAPLDEAPSRKGPSGRFYSPLVRSIAQKEGIAMSELEQVPGTGSEGRVTKKDILSYVSKRTGGPASTPAPAPAPAASPAPAPAPAAAPASIPA
ncbi:MAG: biotin/lipoyl-containing protein, partial [Flavobacteriales bacterium]